MSEAEAKVMVDRIERALYWDPLGGKQDIKDAVETLGEILIDLIKRLSRKEVPL